MSEATKLARVYELQGRITAVRTRVEGMIAENASRRRNHQAFAYHEQSFEEAASEIADYANMLAEVAQERR